MQDRSSVSTAAASTAAVVASHGRKATSSGTADPGRFQRGCRDDLLCSLLGLGVKSAASLLILISLGKLALAHQQRHGHFHELRAADLLQQQRLDAAMVSFDRQFQIGAEQRQLRDDPQWIAPDRRRVVWVP